tara:strand:+ start:2900 stop:3268 length:369 start_codon:yes stop_codon:yes gene_type:complete
MELRTPDKNIIGINIVAKRKLFCSVFVSPAMKKEIIIKIILAIIDNPKVDNKAVFPECKLFAVSLVDQYPITDKIRGKYETTLNINPQYPYSSGVKTRVIIKEKIEPVTNPIKPPKKEINPA